MIFTQTSKLRKCYVPLLLNEKVYYEVLIVMHFISFFIVKLFCKILQIKEIFFVSLIIIIIHHSNINTQCVHCESSSSSSVDSENGGVTKVVVYIFFECFAFFVVVINVLLLTWTQTISLTCHMNHSKLCH